MTEILAHNMDPFSEGSLSGQAAAVIALFVPGQKDAIANGAVQIAALVLLLLAGLGYGKMEASLDADTQTRSLVEKDD